MTYPIIDVTVKEGTVLRFEKQDIIGATVVQEVNPSSFDLPYSTLEFQVKNRYNSLVMFSGETYEMLSQRLPVMAYISAGGVNTLIGRFYLQSWKNESDDVIRFEAIDILGVLSETDYEGGFWETPTSIDDVLHKILAPLDIEYSVDEALLGVTLSGWIPPGDCREAMQQISIASGATVKTSGTTTLSFIPSVVPSDAYKVEVGDDKKSAKQTIELLPLVTKIELVSHTYSKGAEEQDIYEEELEIGKYKIIFEQPYHTVIINGPGYDITTLALESGDDFVLEDGETLLEIGGEYMMGPNSLHLDVTSPGKVTVTGYPWLDSKRAFIFNEEVAERFANRNSLVVSDATLIGLDNAANILEYQRDWNRLRHKQKIRMFSSGVDTTDIVMTGAIQGKQVIGVVLKRTIDLAGGNISDLEILGTEYTE